jgi:hypothetical protein
MCLYCEEKFEYPADSFLHIKLVHPEWEEDMAGLLNGFLKYLLKKATVTAVPGRVQAEGSDEKVVEQKECEKKRSRYSNPDWLKDLKRGFLKEIIEPCSKAVKNAVDQNDKIENVAEKRAVRLEIKNSLVKVLIRTFGGVSRPHIKEVRQLVVELQFIYPAMFRDDESQGYGFGGVKGGEGFASQVLDAVCKKDGLNAKKLKTGEGLNIPGSNGTGVNKKTKRNKEIYGISKARFNESPEDGNSTEKIMSANDESLCLEEREKIYEENRPALQAEIRKTQKPVLNFCRGFWKHQQHIENQFKYSSNAEGLTKAVEANFEKQMRNLELYLKFKSEDLLFIEEIRRIEEKCQVEFGGSRLFKDIMILRMAGDHFDKSGKVLVRLEDDGPPATDSPFLMAVCVDK